MKNIFQKMTYFLKIYCSVATCNWKGLFLPNIFYKKASNVRTIKIGTILCHNTPHVELRQKIMPIGWSQHYSKNSKSRTSKLTQDHVSRPTRIKVVELTIYSQSHLSFVPSQIFNQLLNNTLRTRQPHRPHKRLMIL